MSKYSTKAITLQRDVSTVWTTIAQLDRIEFPDGRVEFLDVTSFDGSAGRAKIPSGFVDTQPCTFGGFFDPVLSSHQLVTDDIASIPSSARDWRIQNPDGATTAWPFSGWVASFRPSAQLGQPLRFDGSIQPTGLVTYPT